MDPHPCVFHQLDLWDRPLANIFLPGALHSVSGPPPSMIDPTIHCDEDDNSQIGVGRHVHKYCEQVWSQTLGRWTTISKAPAQVLIPTLCRQNAPSLLRGHDVDWERMEQMRATNHGHRLIYSRDRTFSRHDQRFCAIRLVCGQRFSCYNLFESLNVTLGSVITITDKSVQ